jgi:putative ABC transport system ATP-binding protein
VAIGRAIVNKPPIILADEPTGNLDTKMGQKVIKIFKELNKEGHTILMVTHNEDNREHVQRTVYLKDGTIIDDSLA